MCNSGESPIPSGPKGRSMLAQGRAKRRSGFSGGEDAKKTTGFCTRDQGVT